MAVGARQAHLRTGVDALADELVQRPQRVLRRAWSEDQRKVDVERAGAALSREPRMVEGVLGRLQ